MLRDLLARASGLGLALVIALGVVSLPSGCGSDVGGGSAPMIKDPPPLPPGEMTSDDYVKQQAKDKAKTKKRR
jgi:hypothetical protein